MEEYHKKGDNVSALVRKRMQKANAKGVRMTFTEAHEEVVADSMKRMFTDGDVYSKLQKLNKADKKLFDKLVEGLESIAQKVKNLYQNKRTNATEGNIITEALDGFDELQSLFVDALDDATHINPFAETDTQKNTDSNTDGVKYDIRYTEENVPVVIVNENILNGVPKSNWVKVVKDAMSGKFSAGIPISGRLIKVNKITRSEFTNSKYSKALKSTDGTVYADKFKSANNLDEIILASTDYINEDLKHTRNDNFVEFARGNVLIRVGNNDYSATVIIGMTSSKNLVLYDIVNFESTQIKIKKTSQSAMLKKAGSERNVKSSTSIIPNSTENVKYDNRGNGYVGKRMSVNAQTAYSEEKMPLSKWNKSEIISTIRSITDVDNTEIEKLTLNELRKNFLKYSEWHHTGAFYNKTDFYEINTEAVENITKQTVNDIIAEREPRGKNNTRNRIIELTKVRDDKIKSLKNNFKKIVGEDLVVKENESYYSAIRKQIDKINDEYKNTLPEGKRYNELHNKWLDVLKKYNNFGHSSVDSADYWVFKQGIHWQDMTDSEYQFTKEYEKAKRNYFLLPEKIESKDCNSLLEQAISIANDIKNIESLENNLAKNVKEDARINPENIKLAEKYFGTTYSIKEAGYLLADGKLLDFSGKHEGAPGGYRTIDHRDIADAFDESYGRENYSDAMIRFMNEGNIRLSPESGGINLIHKPNKAQMEVLSRYISNFRGEVILDIDDEQGNTVSSTEYPKFVHSSVVIKDITDYFDKGKEITKFDDRADIDLYTEKQYNNYGWVRVNNVLNSKDWYQFNRYFADHKLLKNQFAKTQNGETIIPVGENLKYLVYAKGTNKNPIITKVIEIIEDNDYILGRIRDDLIEQERHNAYEPSQIISDYYREGILVRKSLEDYDEFQKLKRGREGRTSNKTNENSREQFDRRTSNETNISELSEIDTKTLYDERAGNIYDLLGENKRLKQENERLAKKIVDLKELLKIQKKITHGKVLEKRTVEKRVNQFVRDTGFKMYGERLKIYIINYSLFILTFANGFDSDAFFNCSSIICV